MAALQVQLAEAQKEAREARAEVEEHEEQATAQLQQRMAKEAETR